jgi:4-amino-4-deoxy-L-arabinose transferase-like glycosyltransferase
MAPKAVSMRSIPSAGRIGITAAYLVIAVLFALRTPAWQAPDEPAHYNYIRQVASGTLIPVLEEGDWDNAYLDQLKTARFQPELLDSLETVQYEDHQPPLYYWGGAIVYALTGGSLTALRFYSILLTVGTVWLTYSIVRLLRPEQPGVALGAMAVVAFLPQQVAMISSVNNDALMGLVAAGTLLDVLRYVMPNRESDIGAPPVAPVGSISPLRLGLWMAIILISKTTIYFMGAVILLALVLRWRREKQPFSILMRQVMMFALPVLVIAALWWGRNLAVYGVPDIMGLRRHDAVVVGQQRTSELIATEGANYLPYAARVTFQSFWGQFGWMAVPMDTVPSPQLPIVYPALGLLTIVCGVGLIVGRLRGIARDHLLIIGAMVALAVLVYIYYNTQFVQFQGRYLFSALIPFAFLMAEGLDAWRRRFVPHAWLLTPAVFALLALLDLYLIWRVIPGALMYGA